VVFRAVISFFGRSQAALLGSPIPGTRRRGFEGGGGRSRLRRLPPLSALLNLSALCKSSALFVSATVPGG